MKIVHLSDLHISVKNLPQNLLYTERLIGYGLENGADHFVFTGDISHGGDAEDYLAFREILQRFGLLNSEKATLVIGNHDIYGGVHLAKDIQFFPKKCRETNVAERIRTFKSYFWETFETAQFPVKEDPMLFVKRVGDVIFLGMNSTGQYSLVRNPFAAAGQVTTEQLAGLRKILKLPEYQDGIKIALVHHHFCLPYKKHKNIGPRVVKYFEEQGNKLHGQRRLMRLFRKYHVDLTLHGHVHYSREYERGRLRFLGGGGAIDKNPPGELKINFVDVLNGEIAISVETISADSQTATAPIQQESLVLEGGPSTQPELRLGYFTLR